MVGVSGRAHRFETRARVALLAAVLAAINVGAWAALLAAAHRFPLLLPLGVTAYLLGLRHAVDPDHIAAIDGTTRKLMHAGQRPVGAGCYFSLGHSTIVFALSVLVAAFGVALQHRFPQLESAGTLVGTSISAIFLIVIALANVAVLLDILRGKGSRTDPLQAGGLFARLLRPALGMVTKSWHLYPVGVLFGLGFDTATEIALLAISAASGAGGMPVSYVLLLPLLFAAGMSLIDSMEGVAMLGAYGWAYLQPARKMFYNINMTLLSITIALFVGGAEAAAAIGTRTGSAPLAHLGNWLSFSTVGFGIVAIFGANLAVSAFVYRFRN
jgi:high-affinity nickel-transport protein